MGRPSAKANTPNLDSSQKLELLHVVECRRVSCVIVTRWWNLLSGKSSSGELWHKTGQTFIWGALTGLFGSLFVSLKSARYFVRLDFTVQKLSLSYNGIRSFQIYIPKYFFTHTFGFGAVSKLKTGNFKATEKDGCRSTNTLMNFPRALPGHLFELTEQKGTRISHLLSRRTCSLITRHWGEEMEDCCRAPPPLLRTVS